MEVLEAKNAINTVIPLSLFYQPLPFYAKNLNPPPFFESIKKASTPFFGNIKKTSMHNAQIHVKARGLQISVLLKHSES